MVIRPAIPGLQVGGREGLDQLEPHDTDLLDALGVTEDRSIVIERDQEVAFGYLLRRLEVLRGQDGITAENVEDAARAVA